MYLPSISQKCNFKISYPDFLPSQVWDRRDPLFEQLLQADMSQRRMVLDIPEFYVGSVMAVTMSDPNTLNKQHKFVGICIRREKQGLQHTFTLRNVIDGLGVEIMYEMYNPTILRIETILLERRLDEDLSYLVDALPEYSTFNFNMEPVGHPAGKPVPVNPLKVKLKPPPWTFQWFQYDVKGIEDTWTLATPWYKRKFIASKDVKEFRKFDIIRHYREAAQELEHDLKVQKRMIEFEEEYQKKKGEFKRKLLKTCGGNLEEISLLVTAKSGELW
uniref:Large ribosomal subunit protein bL19m n=1 Tax=Globodera pallida TaxID=36090 RepID=A0A183BY13_GLOPA